MDVGLAIKYAMLMTHYRSPLNWTDERMKEAIKALSDLTQVAKFEEGVNPPDEFMNALLDDLNTPRAIAVMHKLKKEKRSSELWACLSLLGLVV